MKLKTGLLDLTSQQFQSLSDIEEIYRKVLPVPKVSDGSFSLNSDVFINLSSQFDKYFSPKCYIINSFISSNNVPQNSNQIAVTPCSNCTKEIKIMA